MKSRSEISTFIIFLGVTTALLGFILIPYLSSIFWAVVISLSFIPLHRMLTNTLPHHRNLCAALSTVACILCVILPVLAIATVAGSELKEALDKFVKNGDGPKDLVREYYYALPYISDALNRLGVSDGQAISGIQDALNRIGSSIADTAVPAGQNIVIFFINFFLMCYLLFFLFRDGGKMVDFIINVLPLNTEKCNILIDKFHAVVQATIRGNFVVAAVQGALGGILFLVVGIPSAFLLGTLMAIAALIPVAGSALVWFPIGAYHLLNGEYLTGIIVLLFGALVISLVDNILRPILVGKDIRLPDYVVLYTTLGGLSLMGVEGFVAGPLIAALTAVFWGFFIVEFNSPSHKPNKI